MIDEVIQIFLQYLPTVVAVISVIVTTIKSLKDTSTKLTGWRAEALQEIKETSEQLKKDNQLGEVKLQISELIDQNKKLKKQLKEILEKYSGVRQEDEPNDK